MSDQKIRIGWFLSSEEHDPRDLVRNAVHAENAGFSTAMISDHLRPWTRRQGHASHVWAVLGAIAHATDVLEFGTGVTAIVHRNDPINIAQAAATIAVMSADRFFLGVGTGERLNEQPFGERWPRVGERREQLEEAIEVIQSLWAGGNVNRRGSWNVENLQLMTRPAVAPRLFVASSGKRSAAMAGKAADGIIGVTADRRLIEVFRGAGGEAKPCLGQVHVSVASTMDEAVDNAWEWWPHSVVPPAILSELARLEQFESTAEAIGRGRITDAIVCATDAAPVIDAVDAFVGAGYDTIYLHQIGPDQARLASMATNEILPHYRTQ